MGLVATSKRFRRQLVDAVRSLKVGYPADLQVTMGPIIEPPQGKLLRALTKLDPGESAGHPEAAGRVGSFVVARVENRRAAGFVFDPTKVSGRCWD